MAMGEGISGRFRSRAFCCASVAGLFLLAQASLFGDVKAGDWPGWRGGNLEGRSQSPQGPVHWSSTQNVRWKASIPGEGHSSPIVWGDSVYVTTALKVKEHAVVVSLIRHVQFGALLVLVGFTMRLVVQQCLSASRELTGLQPLIGVTGFVLLSVALGGFVLLGEGMLDFKRDPERGWMAASIVGSLSLAMCGLHPAPRRRACLVSGISLLLFALVVALSIPDKGRAYAGGPFSYLAVFTNGVIALPGLIGLMLLGLYLSEGKQLRRPDSADLVSTSSRAGSLLKWLSLLGTGLILLSITVVVSLVQRRTQVTVSVAEAYTPVVRGWVVATAASLLVAFASWRFKARGSLCASLGFVLSGAVFCSVSLLSILEQLVSRTRYLSYLLGATRLTPMLGGKSLWTLATVAVLSLMVSLVGGRRGGKTEGVSPSPIFYLAAVLLAALYFADVNFVPKGGQFIRAIISIDRVSGRLKWICKGLSAPRGSLHSDNSPATPTAVSDGEHVFAYFGTAGILCVDHRGRVVWRNRQLPFESREGVATSPILCEGRVIILSESEAGRYLAALDCATGKLIWRTDRNKKIHSYAGNCRTPSVKKIRGKEVILVWGSDDLSGYDPSSGREVWSYNLGDFGSGANPVASLVSDDRRSYLAGPGKIMAVERSGLGGHETPVAWQREIYDGAQCASPVLVEGLLFTISDNGTASCTDARNGETLWRRQFGRQHFASPVAVGNRLYFCDTKGVTTVVACEGKYRRVSMNEVEEPTYASLAPVGGQIFLRTVKRLYCIEEK